MNESRLNRRHFFVEQAQRNEQAGRFSLSD